MRVSYRSVNRDGTREGPTVELSSSVREFLTTQPVGHLATADASGVPHVVPVCFALDGDVVVIVVDEKPKMTTRLKRLRNIEQNPSTALVVDVYDADWSRLRWVMVRGSATVVLEGAECEASLEALRDKYPQYRTMELAGRPLIRIQPERVNEWYGDQG